MNARKKLAVGVLASGGGTNLQAIIDASESGRLDACVSVLISDVPGSGAIKRAERHSIPAFAVPRSEFPSKHAFESRIVELLKSKEVELVCLAGYMRIVGRTMLESFPNRIINIHPALLPSFPGLEAQRQALEHGVKVSGCTVHFVDELTDHGPVIRQAAVEVMEDDTAETLGKRILEQEHRIYPEAIQLFAERKLTLEGRRVKIGQV